MNKQVHTYNPCSVCGKEVSDIKVYGGNLYCKEHLPKNKQEWLNSQLSILEGKLGGYMFIDCSDINDGITLDANFTLEQLKELVNILEQYKEME